MTRIENDKLREALRYGIGAAINDLTSRGHPLKWSPDSGIGRMLAALGCREVQMNDAVRAILDD